MIYPLGFQTKDTMKKSFLLLTICAISLIFSSEQSQIREKQPPKETFQITNFHEEVKKFVFQALSFVNLEDCVSSNKLFCNDDYFNSLDEEKRDATLHRYYTLVVAASALMPKQKNDSELLEKLRNDLEEEYDISINPVSSLSIENEDRKNVAYTLFLANALALMPSKDFHKTYKDQLSLIGFGSKHDKRALQTSFKFISFLALKNASEVFKGDEEKLRELNKISKALYKNRLTTVEVANMINKMFI
ncbi:MAG: hypothetical protein S4CHLAM20_05570 [Chlamydiia bacterium]|nr:hypothetical protein [Chlamydiia bacterium]